MQTQSALKWRVTSRTTRRGADRRTTARPSTCAGASQRRRRRCPVAQSDSSETWNRALSAIVVVEMYRTILKSALQKQLCAVRALCKPNLHVKRLYSSKCMHMHPGSTHLKVNPPREMAVPLLAAEQGCGANCVAHDAVAAAAAAASTAAANRCDLIQYADDGRFAEVPATVT